MKKTSLARRIVICFSVISLLVSLLISVASYYQIRSLVSENTQKIIKDSINNSVEENKFIFYANDEDEINTWLDSLINVHTIKAAKLYNSQNYKYVSKHYIENTKRNLLSLDHEFNTNNGNITWKINILTKQDNTKLSQQTLYAVGSIFIAVTLFTIPILFFLSNLIVKPLVTLKNELNELNPEDLQKNNIHLNIEAPLELIPVVEIINSLISRVSDYTNSLNEKVLQRTNLLSDAFIQQQQFEHDKSIIYTNLSHDLKTPLTAILNYSELSQEDIESGDNQSAIENLVLAQQNINRMILDIQELLSIFTSDIDNTDDITEFNFHDLCTDQVTKHESHSLKSRNTVTFDYQGPKIVQSSEHILIHVIDNLLNNANKFCLDGIISIQVTVDKQISFTIKDEGIGIQGEDYLNIFEPKSKTGKKGSGYGLFTCKQRLLKLRGSIRCTNNIDKGASFEFMVPNEMGN